MCFNSLKYSLSHLFNFLNAVRPIKRPGQQIDLDFIISKDKVEEEDKLEDIFTEKSYIPYNAVGEASLRTLKKGETIQVERRGFYICDEAYLRPEEPIKLIFVPDGKNMMGVKNPEATSLYTVRTRVERD